MIELKIRKTNDGKLMFYCQGCNEHHGVDDKWNFNGSFENPTFNPSILVRGTRLTEKGLADLEKWQEAGYPSRNGEPFESVPTVCHSFIRDGIILYLNDCTHELAGKTVELLDEEEWLKG